MTDKNATDWTCVRTVPHNLLTDALLSEERTNTQPPASCAMVDIDVIPGPAEAILFAGPDLDICDRGPWLASRRLFDRGSGEP
jgi:hypothetical protein